MAGGLDDILSWLLRDPNQPGGTGLMHFLGVGSPTASTQTPTIVPSSGSRPPLALGSPMLGGAPATSSGGLLGGQLPASGYGAASRGLRSGLFGGGMLGSSPLVDMLGGALAGLANVQPGQTGLAAIGAGAQGATTAADARRQEQIKNWYMQNQVAQAAQKTADDAARKQELETYIASLPPDQQAAARLEPAAFIGAGLKGAEPPKSRMLPQGNMQIPQDWDPTTKTWVTTGPPAPRWAPPSPGASVSVNMPPMESTASKTAGEVVGKDVGNVITEGRQAPANIGNLDRLQSMLDQIHSGKGTTTINDLKKAALTAGIDLTSLGITDNTGVVDAARALSNQMALKLRSAPDAGMPGAMSDADRTFLSSMTPNIENTPEGNKLIIQWNRRIEQRKEALANITRNYIKGHGGNIDAGVYDEYQKYSDAHPLFTDADRQAAAAAAGGGPGGAPAQTPTTTWTREKPATLGAGASDQAQQTWYDGLPVGSFFINPADGRLMQKTH